MNRFEKAVEILDSAVGGPNAPVGFHGSFWRGVTRNEFVAKKIFGLQLITVGDGAGSNLVKALKGESPFGADLENPPPDASFNRMPSGRRPVSDADIAFIETWIDDGCLEDETGPAAGLTWRKTNAPIASSRTDDIWFLDPNTGWAVNSDGNILKTSDGGRSWVVQHSAPRVYLRCVGFANTNVGWVGTLTRNQRLLHTSDGGANWSKVSPPANAPVAICGLSVVSDQVVFASGTNRPNDVPGMMKTLDGGANWTAWDMSAHASILIDTYFKDALHGWVVGGKADEATPTTRDKIKPVVLETTDGGATWTNRLAGQEASFPFGEWGWKIFFLSDVVGFISLENFDAGAILKTIDGGQTWSRLKVNDTQGNANLEGIGFIDEERGWVGGWGSRDFSKGFSSATTDGGQNWRDGNEIGHFINRFRFFGNPVSVGYASGDTIYKYSSDPVPISPVSFTSRLDPASAMLPDRRITSSALPIPIRINVPLGTKRLTLHVWDRFGAEVGCVFDEIRPQSGPRLLSWDGSDGQGQIIGSGDYIFRLMADDLAASSILTHRVLAGDSGRLTARGVVRRAPLGIGSRPSAKTVAALMGEFAAPQRDLHWLSDALQIAVQLELATLPPYLVAYWTVKDTGPVARSIREIWREEMLHFGLACNLLVAIGGTPVVADTMTAPKYPGDLPGGVRPGLRVALRKLSLDQTKVFMDIEFPQGGPVALTAAAPGTRTFDAIGEFYEAILAAFRREAPSLNVARQIKGPLGLYMIETMAKVEEAIHLINLQGEGSKISPEERPGDLAHFYRFGEVYHGKRFLKNASSGKWGYTGDPVSLPQVWDMADIPEGGYQQGDVPDLRVWNLIATFDQSYSNMLRLLQSAWQHGDPQILGQAVGAMFQMHEIATALVQEPRADGPGNYGPCFRYVP